MTSVAIMQPTYLPWMGYFGMIDSVDVFVFYDDVQFVQRSWQRRNKIKTANGWTWLTVPVIECFGQNINEVRVNNDINWSEKHWKSIVHSYKKAPYFEEFSPEFGEYYNSEHKMLLDVNLTFIKAVCRRLGIKTELILSSELGVDGSKTDRLINVLKKVGADRYISSPASGCYMENDKFFNNNIDLFWYEFSHPQYNQLYGEFIPYMSVIDLLFNEGAENSIDLIRSGKEGSLRRETSLL
ncbi:MAG: WbqC family protein [Methanomicrobiaceae archaeon]|nr:WbqC family protein [Methanomicrobiaceae archaeon]